MQYLKESVRNKILDSAREEFHLHGYHRGSLKTIAEEANITPGNIYRYFSSKENLLNQLLQPVYEEFEALIQAIEIRDYHKNSIEKTGERIEKILGSFEKEIGILVHVDTGSAFKEKIVQLATRRLMTEMNCEEELASLLGATFSDSLFLILKEYRFNKEAALRIMQKLLYFFFRDGSEVDLYN